MLPTQLFEIFHEVLIGEPAVREGALADVEACRERVSHGVLVFWLEKVKGSHMHKQSREVGWRCFTRC
jgi:hypothetical protein